MLNIDEVKSILGEAAGGDEMDVEQLEKFKPIVDTIEEMYNERQENENWKTKYDDLRADYTKRFFAPASDVKQTKQETYNPYGEPETPSKGSIIKIDDLFK